MDCSVPNYALDYTFEVAKWFLARTFIKEQK